MLEWLGARTRTTLLCTLKLFLLVHEGDKVVVVCRRARRFVGEEGVGPSARDRPERSVGTHPMFKDFATRG